MCPLRVDRRSVVICLFAKPPVRGQAKMRLSGALGATAAAHLARAFLLDSWEALRRIRWAEPVLATTTMAGLPGDLRLGGSPEGPEVWLQVPGNLGTRIERILSRALARAGAAIAIGADTPGLPVRFFEAARRALSGGWDAALGPSTDGGFYLLGLRRCPPGLLRGVPWSTSRTCDATLRRLRRAGLRTAVLPEWFDVDRPRDLARLQALLAAGTIHAPRTAAELGLRQRALVAKN